MSSELRMNGVDLDAELAQLLLEQEHFVRQKKHPSAKVSRRGAGRTVSSSQSPLPASNSARDEEIQVLKSVVERQVTARVARNLNFCPEPTGFPAVYRQGAGKSRFGRRCREAQASEPEDDANDLERRNIDAANRATLQAMSKQEILEAQQELRTSLDPKVVEKLKGRRNNGNKIKAETRTAESSTMQVKALSKGASVKEEARQKEEWSKHLAAVRSEQELQAQETRLSAAERAKLDWTQLRSTSQRRGDKLGAAMATDATLERFDLDGTVLEATDTDLPVHSGLFHHGQDPHVAGYTVPELLHLARSSVASQRAMALNVVAKILLHRQRQSVRSRGVAPRVLPRDMAWTLRMGLDDPNLTALSAAIAAVHAFMVPLERPDKCHVAGFTHGTIVFPPTVHVHGDEVEIDALSHEKEVERVVYIDLTAADDPTRTRDKDVVALDPVQGLLHMGLATRLWYLLDTNERLDCHATEKILDILTAVARHSPRAAKDVSCKTPWLQLLQDQYIENEHALTLQLETMPRLHLCCKALKFVRVACQGHRSVASALGASGLIQSTKGFLALNDFSTGDRSDESGRLMETVQVESLGIWQILLGYGLDFHCLAYLFPVLVRLLPQATGARKVALFAALDAVCAIESNYEAQHYFTHLNWFVNVAKDDIVASFCVLLSPSGVLDGEISLLLATMLRFLFSASSHAKKYHLKTKKFVQVLKLVQSSDVLQLLPRLTETIETRELLVSIVRFHMRIVRNDDLCTIDMDDDEVRTFLNEVQSPLLGAATSAVASSSEMNATLIQACELVVLVEELDIVHCSAAFVQKMYHQACILVRRLGSGGEYWVTRLFASVVFHPTFLQQLGVFRDKADATRMSRVLIPIYQALVNATRDQETHSMQLFTPLSSVSKMSCHLYLPQEERSYLASNLPLPSFWVVSPLSCIEYNSNSGKSTDAMPSHSDEMKLIVSATCRFVCEIEQSVATLSSMAELKPEDKLFHLLHVFFAGSDVLFDDDVDVALQQLLPKLVTPIFHPQTDEKLLATGFLRNLKRNQSLASRDVAATSCASDERQLLAFVEKFVAEFTASSFGNLHFAQCVTLLVTDEFSLKVRKFVWKELLESHLVHTLAPFHEAKAEILRRCTRTCDVEIVHLMQQAVCNVHVSPVRGSFAYTVAIHHLVNYLFAESSGNTMSVARQHLAQVLASEATPAIWGHLLSYDVTNKSLLTELHDAIRLERATTLRSQASFSPEQLLAFDATVSMLRH